MRNKLWSMSQVGIKMKAVQFKVKEKHSRFGRFFIYFCGPVRNIENYFKNIFDETRNMEEIWMVGCSYCGK